MTQQSQPPPDVLGALPHRRPSRRSEKRGPSAPPRPERTSAAPSAPPRSERTSAAPSARTRPQRDSTIVGTVVQAAAELAEIGLSASARALKEALARLPRP